MLTLVPSYIAARLNADRWAAGAVWSANPFRSYTWVADVHAGCASLVVLALVVQGVVRRLVVRSARYGQRDRVLGVIPIEARCAGVIPCWCGAVMRGARERQ